MKNLFPIIFLFFICSCGNIPSDPQFVPDELFDQYKTTFVEELWQMYPDWSTYEGYGKYDSILRIPNEENRQKEISFIENHLSKLSEFDLSALSPVNRTDYELIKNQLEKSLWQINVFKSYEWNPANYNVAGGFAMVLGNKNLSLDEKIERISKRLSFVPAYYQAAQSNIKQPTLEHTDLAIQQVKGAAGYLNSSVRDSAKTALNENDFKTFEESLNAAVNATEAYVDYLKIEIKPNIEKDGARNFRIGKELFEQKFAFDIQSRFTAEEIFNKATERKAELHEKMYELAKELYPKYFPGKKAPEDRLALTKSVIEKISMNHVHRDSFIPSIEKQIPELEQFIKDKNLIYLDPSKPLVVRKTPDYMDGVAGASISAPGPYDKEGDTFYNVTPLTGYSDQEAESYLREYNHYVLQILNIHEAIPGHYMQLVYSNQSPSIIKSILGNGSMVEGWAVYTERMMLEEGYGNNEPEMWLMYYKWHLRVVCNTILDYSVHVLNFNEQQGLDLLMKEAFQESAEAKGKWKRATLSQVQLCSYFTGYTEIYALREEIKQKEGTAFNLKAFHEKFLSFGSAPVKFIRELMMG
jgi:uncharacterized protein (DUF885 family)